MKGFRRNGLARLDFFGSLALGFKPGEGTNAEVLALVHEPMGDIYIGGAFTEYDGYPREGIGRINGDPRVLRAEIVDGVFRVWFNSISGRLQVPQYKGDWNWTSWTPVSSVVGNGELQSLSDLDPIYGMRVYRLYLPS